MLKTTTFPSDCVRDNNKGDRKKRNSVYQVNVQRITTPWKMSESEKTEGKGKKGEKKKDDTKKKK